MESQNKKRVLLLITFHYTFYENIIESLENMGYEVVYFDKLYDGFKYNGTKEKLTNFFRKTFLNDKKFKERLKEKHLEDHIQSILNFENNYFDYALFIRPDYYSINVINYIKNIAKKTIAYQWDGMSRYGNSEKLIPLFDSFNVFDQKDFLKYKTHHNVHLNHNFFFKSFSIPNIKKYDVFYIGAEQENRFEILNSINLVTKKLNLNSYFRLYTEKKRKKSHKPIIINNEKLSYSKLVSLSSQSKCIIDLKIPTHNGLSFRFFEALHFQQKIITDNTVINEFDFYNPNNILVIDDWENLNEKTLIDFLQLPYIEIEEKTKSKYSFENWFNNIINT